LASNHETADPEATRRARIPLAVWWLLGISAIIKLVLIGPVAELPEKADERQYVAAARAIHETGYPSYPNPNWDEAHQAPGMPYFLGACHVLAGEGGFKTLARVVQVLLSLGTVVLVFLIARRFLPERTAVLATALIALNPTHIAFTHYFWSEGSYTFFSTLVAWLLVRSRGAPREGLGFFLAGLVGGVACLWRSVFLTQVPVVCLWILVWGLGRTRERVRVGALFVGGFLLVLAPWAARNTLRYDRFLLVSTNAGALLAKAANPIRPETHDIGLESWRREYDAYYREHGPDFEGVIALRPLVPRDPAENLVDRNKREIRAGFSFMLDHPGLAVEHTWIRIGYFFNPTSYLVRHMREDFYPSISGFLEEVLVALALAFTLGLFVFFVLGVTAGSVEERRDPYRAFLILMFLGTLAIYAVTGVQSRSRLPIEPLMAPLAADAILRLRALGGRAWLLAAPVLFFLAYVWAKYLPLNYA
jgi:4-amino-4-deoxy-L-arabinose transferase-like glycosyltransferase